MQNAVPTPLVSRDLRRAIAVHGIPAGEQYRFACGYLEARASGAMANASDEGRRHILRDYLRERAGVDRAYRGGQR